MTNYASISVIIAVIDAVYNGVYNAVYNGVYNGERRLIVKGNGGWTLASV
jgi:hypothetical protein